MSKLSKAELALLLAQEAGKAVAVEYNAVKRELALATRYVDGASQKKRDGQQKAAKVKRSKYADIHERYARLKAENPKQDDVWIRQHLEAHYKVTRKTIKRALAS
jgi:hypothetical protein